MDEENVQRKLSAIFSADVAGYSRLMREDEMGTIKRLSEYRELMYSLIKQHRGRVVDSPGDNLLAEFSSVVDAVQSAVAIQRELKARNTKLPENRKMEFRIGINIGDVVQEGDRIYGDGVNIAARLESMAEPGGICISRPAYDQIESKLPLGYEYLGKRVVKNISKPLYAYRVIIDQENEPREEERPEGGESRKRHHHSRHEFSGEHFEQPFREVKGHLKDFAREIKDDEEIAETFQEIKGRVRKFADNVSGSSEQRQQAIKDLFHSKHLKAFTGIACFLFLINALTSFGRWWFQYPTISLGLVFYLHWLRASFFSPDKVEALRERLLQKELAGLDPEYRGSEYGRWRARTRANARVHFYSHLYVYAGVNAFLIIINLLSNPFKWWFPFPLLAWGVILFIHWIKLR
jgi:class 3 adenylate cyclase